MRVALFYATWHGQTRRIAEHVTERLQTEGIDVELFDVRHLNGPVDWSQYATACIAASVHAGRHEDEVVHFARTYRRELDAIDAMFLSVTFTESRAEDPAAPTAVRAEAAATTSRFIHEFIAETGWHPARALPVAGALLYSRCWGPTRAAMTHFAREVGAPTDPSRDYEFTNWPALDQFIAEMVRTAETRLQAAAAY